jgi:LAS superfamily LD-carboxypeptidase LdcB
MPTNGKLSSSELSAIPSGRLRKDAADAWNAMHAEIKKKTGIDIRPSGARSSYRTYSEQQYFWNLYQSGKGNLAASPGTSNHGWGLAVDVK